MLQANILALVKMIPAHFTGIVANLAKLGNVATFYGLVAGDSHNGPEGGETFDGTIGVLRYLIAHGDTSLAKYNQIALSGRTKGEVDLESMERNKYLIYAHFEEARKSKGTAKDQNEVIEIEWD